MGFFKNVIASLLFVSTGKPGRLKLGHWAEQQRIHLKKKWWKSWWVYVYTCVERREGSRGIQTPVGGLQRAHFLNKTCSLFGPKASLYLAALAHWVHPTERKPVSSLCVGLRSISLISLTLLPWVSLCPASPSCCSIIPPPCQTTLLSRGLMGLWEGDAGRLDFTHQCIPWPEAVLMSCGFHVVTNELKWRKILASLKMCLLLPPQKRGKLK